MTTNPQRCETCRWCSKTNLFDTGECRANPPSLDRTRLEQFTHPTAAWPTVSLSWGWCGQWTAREEAT